MASIDESDRPKYIYNLPFFQRSELCKILNQSEKWEELAGVWMNYDMLTIQNLRKEKNPTDELLTLWSTHNHTILELFILLGRMQHYRAMILLKSFVDIKYHKLIDKGEGNIKNVFAMPHNRECGAPQLLIPPSNSNNLLVPSPTLNRVNSVSQMMNELTIGKCDITLPKISYDELSRTTNGWSVHNILGKGGYGTVYRGIWKNTEVAIKKIERRGHDSDENNMIQLQQSLREITILNSRPHENILPLYAYSIGGDAPCLVYQFMSNGSVEDRLLLWKSTPPLSWLQRYEIAKGTARGLQYLHTIGDKPLIHGDIKSANILLDRNFEPKIGDFGLTREGPAEDSMKVSRVYGTRPYIPDEFLRGKTLSIKVDTYSYGIVLFELATGLTAYSNSRKDKFLKDHMDNCSNDNLSLLIDKKAGDKCNRVYLKLIELGKECTNKLAKDRPEMQWVFSELNEFQF